MQSLGPFMHTVQVRLHILQFLPSTYVPEGHLSTHAEVRVNEDAVRSKKYGD